MLLEDQLYFIINRYYQEKIWLSLLLSRSALASTEKALGSIIHVALKEEKKQKGGKKGGRKIEREGIQGRKNQGA